MYMLFIEKRREGNLLFGLADHLPNVTSVGRVIMLLRLVIKGIDTGASEGRITMVDIDRSAY